MCEIRGFEAELTKIIYIIPYDSLLSFHSKIVLDELATVCTIEIKTEEEQHE